MATKAFSETLALTDPGQWLLIFGESAGEPTPGEHLAGALAAGPSLGPTLRLRGDPGSLPAFARGQSMAVVFDGILYNRAELARLLPEAAGREANDAELLLLGYQAWGENLLLKIKGIFALIIWDGDREVLLAVRDPLGLYPLFYAQGRNLAMATAIEAIRLSGLPVSLNRAALADHLRHRWPSKEETFYTEIRRVPPGHVLRAGRGGVQASRYWHPAPPGSPVQWLREDELQDFDASLGEAVNRCLDQGPAGIYLSGGIDSVSVAAVAADNCRSRGLPQPLALSLAFPELGDNEVAIQRGVAAQLHLDQVLLSFDEALGGRDLLTAELEIGHLWPQPLMNAWLPAYASLAAESRRRGVKVILTGNGGDEWLGVGPFLAADLLRTLDIKGLWHLWRTMRDSFILSLPRMFLNNFWFFGLRPLIAGKAQGLLSKTAPEFWRQCRVKKIEHSWPNWLAPDPGLRQEMRRRTVANLTDLPTEGFYFEQMQSGLDHQLVSMEHEENFEKGRRLGVRMLHPYWDSDLVKLLYRVPPALLHRGGRNKGLVREMLWRRFPQLGFERQKKVSATSFFCGIMLRHGKNAWSRLGGAKTLAELGIVDAAKLDLTIQSILASGDQRAAHVIRDVLTIEAWVRPRW